MRTKLLLGICMLSTIAAFAQTGNVGIGTSSPDSKLHIRHTALGELGGLTLSQGTNNSEIYHNTDGDLVLRKRENSDQLVLDNSGNIGIGTVAPNHRLHIVQTTTGGESMLAMNTTDDDGFLNMGNVTGAANIFAPGIFGRHTSSNRAAIAFFGIIDDTFDNTANAQRGIFRFVARNGDNANIVRERDLFQIFNNATLQTAVEADGDLHVDNGDNVIKMSNNITLFRNFDLDNDIGSNSGNNSFNSISNWPGNNNSGISLSVDVEAGDKVLIEGFIEVEGVPGGATTGNAVFAFKIKCLANGSALGNTNIMGSGNEGVAHQQWFSGGNDNFEGQDPPTDGTNHRVPAVVMPIQGYDLITTSGTRNYFFEIGRVATSYEYTPTIKSYSLVVKRF